MQRLWLIHHRLLLPKCRLIWQGTNSSGQQAIVFACLPVSIKAFLKLKRVCLCIISQDDCAAAEVTGVSSDGVAHSKRHRSRSPGIRWSTASQPVRPSAVVNAKWRSGTIPKRRSLLFRSLKLFEGPWRLHIIVLLFRRRWPREIQYCKGRSSPAQGTDK